jgi:hypothetical protein
VLNGVGEPFWLNRTVPTYCKSSAARQSPDCAYKTYLEMDAQTRSDAEQLLASFVRTLVQAPDASSHSEISTTAISTPLTGFPRMVYNERSLYMVPRTRQLSLLLRGVHGGLSVSTCQLPSAVTVPDEGLFSCRPVCRSQPVSVLQRLDVRYSRLTVLCFFRALVMHS